jgi:S-adenosylmethionine hydrolase
VVHSTPSITLTTDFGDKDWFVGTMKGVILSLAPRVAIVDITHEIPSGDIQAGAFALAATWRFFPKGTIHVVVVDPGVGSARKGVAIETAHYWFVGPDNGVLSLALRQQKIRSIHALTNEAFFLRPVSRTFQGRDIFAPVAAHLSAGVPTKKFGPALKNFVWLPWPEPRLWRDRIEGEIVYLDRFGNGITNISSELPLVSKATSCHMLGKRGRKCPLKKFYQAVAPGKPVCVPGSSGFLEIAINGGSAAEALRLKIGTAVRVS